MKPVRLSGAAGCRWGRPSAKVQVRAAAAVYLGPTLDLQSCLDVPDQLACGDSPQDLVGGLCLAAGGVLAVGGIGLAVVSRTAGRWWWPALGGAAATDVVLLGIAIAQVVP